MLAREVLRLRGTLANREVEWDVVVDLYFYRDPESEEAKEEEEEETKPTDPTVPEADPSNDWAAAGPTPGTAATVPDASWDAGAGAAGEWGASAGAAEPAPVPASGW